MAASSTSTRTQRGPLDACCVKPVSDTCVTSYFVLRSNSRGPYKREGLRERSPSVVVHETRRAGEGLWLRDEDSHDARRRARGAAAAATRTRRAANPALCAHGDRVEPRLHRE